MLVTGQRVADEDGVGSIGIQPAIGFIADFEHAQALPRQQCERTGQHRPPVKAEALVIRGEKRRRHDIARYGVAARLSRP